MGQRVAIGEEEGYHGLQKQGLGAGVRLDHEHLVGLGLHGFSWALQTQPLPSAHLGSHAVSQC